MKISVDTNVLARAEPSPVVELNRAVAVAMRDGPKAGLALIEAILARGELVDLEKLPGGELRARAARPTGTIDGLLHSLDGKVRPGKPLSIEDINRITAAGWAGDLDHP